MLPNEKLLKSLMKKIKKNAEKKYEEKQVKVTSTPEIEENIESNQMFREMKKLPFSE